MPHVLTGTVRGEDSIRISLTGGDLPPAQQVLAMATKCMTTATWQSQAVAMAINGTVTEEL